MKKRIRPIIPDNIELRSIPKYPEHSISECGKYITNLKGISITQSEQVVKGRPSGYYYSTLLASDYKYFQRVAVHRLVAYAWLSPPESPNHVWINHKDGNKANNHASNLEWTTISQNIQHAYDTGLKKSKSGQEHHLFGRKIPLETRMKMRIQKLGRNHPKWKGDYIVFGKRYHSANEAGIALNIPPKTVQQRALNPKFIDYSFIPKENIFTGLPSNT